MAQEARVVQLQSDLAKLNYFGSLRALNWMIETMNATNGYKRHDGSNYYYHLVDSTQDLINHGVRNESVITACILHDSIEDIEDVNFQSIANDFGHGVAYLVDGVTKKEGINYKEAQNMKDYLNYILSNYGMCLIKTADRKHNFSTLGNSNEKFELRQALETERYFIPFFKEARKNYPEYSAYFHSAKTSIMPHLKKIKKYHEVTYALKAEIESLKLQLQKKELNTND